MTELLVAVALVAILLSIFIPYAMSLRDQSARVRCADRLRQLQAALSAYGQANDGALPQVRVDENRPDRYTAYTGDTQTDPFAEGSAVQANDVSASLWLLVRQGYAPAEASVCPGSSATPYGGDQAGLLGNYSRGSLSYSYASPFSSLDDYSLNSDRLRGEFVVLADMNPGVDPLTESPAITPDSPPLVLARGNSRNHRGGGQNVLYGAGNVEFHVTPYCGFGGDNIYTALRSQPLGEGEQPPANAPGVLSRDIGPAWYADSYLVPTESD